MENLSAIAGFLGIAALTGIFWYCYFRRKENQLLNRLRRMIDQAMAGGAKTGCEKDEAVPREISESKYSALENSLKRYVDESVLLGESREKQKDIIQGLISDIAHQTLTPVSNLKLYTELLEEELEGHSRELDTIREQTEKLNFLIQSLVKLSRMENGIISLHPQKNAVFDLLEDIGKEYMARAKEKGIRLIIPENRYPMAVFDRKWTREALGNIVDNALKYTGEGGGVTITADVYSFFVRVDIADTGIGIQKEEINKIFTRFYRSEEVSEYPGVGIGLYLTREIIQAQKGYLKVTSKKGEGSVFSVFLPLA